VEAALDSEAGIRAYKARPFDLVITDLFMPDRGGLDVAGRIRAFDSDARLILVTGMDLRERVDIFSLARQLGVLHTLTKPIAPEKLRTCIREALAS
jgi:CheY-like chemotaxis protein